MKTVYLIYSPANGYLDGYNEDFEWTSDPRKAWALYPLDRARRRLGHVKARVPDAMLTDRKGRPIE